MVEPKFYGVIAPFITPFDEDLSIDVEAVRWLARYQAEKGVHGIFPNSTTGEFVHLKKEESVKIARIVLEEVGGRVWVIPGISSNCTEHSIELGREFQDMGVDGVVVTPPYFFKVAGERLKLHFSKIAEKVDLPIIVYNIPSTTGINIPVELYTELAEEYSNIAGAKVTYDNLNYFRKLIVKVKAVRKDFTVLTGVDYLLLPVLMIGGDGGIMALANVAPQIHRAVYDAWIHGDIVKAYEEYKKLLKLVEIYDIATSFPTSVKTSLKVLGAPVKPYVRPPLTAEPPENEEKIKSILNELGVRI
ncbi:MAG: 4-hydroxy-tetrahydrodipicolinate synthase [Thermoprotei archaeon]|nr:MAG: 4-hydroxy-tetrahydrodipicolinate synthase [Thermoprotei archaeon]